MYIQTIDPRSLDGRKGFTCQRCGARLPRGETQGKVFRVEVTDRHYGDYRDWTALASISVCGVCAQPFQAYRWLRTRAGALQRLERDAHSLLDGVRTDWRYPVEENLRLVADDATEVYEAERERVLALLPEWAPSLVTDLEKLLAAHPGWTLESDRQEQG